MFKLALGARAKDRTGQNARTPGRTRTQHEADVIVTGDRGRKKKAAGDGS